MDKKDPEIKSRLLIVDDDKDVRDTLMEFFVEKGFDAHTAGSGMEAIRLLKVLRPHLILLDVKMPEMSGLETLKKIRELDREVGIIMVTGLRDHKIGRESLKYGASDYITKPIDLHYLETSIMEKIQVMLGSKP
jgi:two-component system response regulator (stage 0 sporulation protein F)